MKISTKYYPIKPKFLRKICRDSLSVNTSQQIARFQKGYSSCTEGKIQWKFSQVTVTVTGKVIAVSSQSPYFHLQTDRQTDRQTDKQSDRQTDRQTDKLLLQYDNSWVDPTENLEIILHEHSDNSSYNKTMYPLSFWVFPLRGNSSVEAHVFWRNSNHSMQPSRNS